MGVIWEEIKKTGLKILFKLLFCKTKIAEIEFDTI